MKSLFLIVMLFLISSFGYAHLCHDPFRPSDCFVLVPEKKLIRIEKEGEFRIYVENTFSSDLRDLRLIIASTAFDIETVPANIEMLVPGERSFYLVKLKLREGFKPGDYPLRISVKARSAELRASVESVDLLAEEIPELPVQPTPEIEPEVKTPEGRVEPQAEEAGELVVRVEEFVLAKRWYIYLVPILILFGLLIWRKLKQG